MTHPIHHRFRWLLLCALGALVVSAVAGGCSSSGYSPSCPPLPLYNVLDASNAPKVVSARRASANAGCSTEPGDASNGVAGGGNPSPVDAGGG